MAFNFLRKNEIAPRVNEKELEVLVKPILSEVVNEVKQLLIKDFLPLVLEELNEYKKNAISEITITPELKGLPDEKKANEILSILFEKIGHNHPSSLRPFYTELEIKFGKPLSMLHKERIEKVPNKGDGKYPYRKMDTVLLVFDYKEVYEFAKQYKFTKLKKKGA
jgi:hypothetical protein